MRLFSLLIIIALSYSCGKDSSTGGGPGRQFENNTAADGQGVDLLEAMIDVPVVISGNEITFKAPKSNSSEGRRIRCDMTVQAGDVYRYSQSGQSLTLMTPEGNFDFTKTSSGDGLHGTWRWKGYVDQGTHIVRTISFLSDTRMIMRKACEI